MNTQQFVMGAYRLLLQFYPPAFRQRFAPEMLELAEAAGPAEWPLIFSDTSVAIVRCWVEGSPSTTALAEPNSSFSLGGSPARSLGLGFVLSTALLLSLAYVGYRWPPPCQATRPLLTHVVAPPPEAAHTVQARQTSQSRRIQQ